MCDTTLQPQAVPAYFHPADHHADWETLASAASVGLVVANISNGPGIVREEQWARALGGVRQAGAEVVGYVDSGYLGLTGLRTRLGSNLIDHWLEQLLADIIMWYRLYGDLLTGIFFDQVAESDDGASVAPVFRRLREHVLQQDPEAVTVLNPGVAVPQAFAGIADILVTFEGRCDDYLSEDPETGYEPLPWRPGPDQTIWHIIHDIPDSVRAAEVVALSRQRGASLLYVTDGVGENPYSTLPSTDIWAASIPAASNWAARPRRREPKRRRRSTSSISATPVVVATVPEGKMISNPSVTRTPPAIEASADFLVPASCRRVFLASRRRDVPRWWTGSTPQIAADWLIENDRLYAYAGSGTDWTWTPSGRVLFEVDGNRARWCLDADREQFGDDADAVFHVSAPGHVEYSDLAVGVSRPGISPKQRPNEGRKALDRGHQRGSSLRA
jgi:hypothetical protein